MMMSHDEQLLLARETLFTSCFISLGCSLFTAPFKGFEVEVVDLFYFEYNLPMQWVWKIKKKN
jgi:hypothetical protein